MEPQLNFDPTAPNSIGKSKTPVPETVADQPSEGRAPDGPPIRALNNGAHDDADGASAVDDVPEPAVDAATRRAIGFLLNLIPDAVLEQIDVLSVSVFAPEAQRAVWARQILDTWGTAHHKNWPLFRGHLFEQVWHDRYNVTHARSKAWMPPKSSWEGYDVVTIRRGVKPIWVPKGEPIPATCLPNQVIIVEGQLTPAGVTGHSMKAYREGSSLLDRAQSLAADKVGGGDNVVTTRGTKRSPDPRVVEDPSIGDGYLEGVAGSANGDRTKTHRRRRGRCRAGGKAVARTADRTHRRVRRAIGGRLAAPDRAPPTRRAADLRGLRSGGKEDRCGGRNRRRMRSSRCRCCVVGHRGGRRGMGSGAPRPYGRARRPGLVRGGCRERGGVRSCAVPDRGMARCDASIQRRAVWGPPRDRSGDVRSVGRSARPWFARVASCRAAVRRGRRRLCGEARAGRRSAKRPSCRGQSRRRGRACARRGRPGGRGRCRQRGTQVEGGRSLGNGAHRRRGARGCRACGCRDCGARKFINGLADEDDFDARIEADLSRLIREGSGQQR